MALKESNKNRKPKQQAAVGLCVGAPQSPLKFPNHRIEPKCDCSMSWSVIATGVIIFSVIFILV